MSTQKTELSEQPQQKPQVLEEDDEFEDFPVEGILPQHSHPPTETQTDTNPTKHTDWPQEEAEPTSGSTANGGSEHLWEESWDDDDAAEDFSKQLQCVYP
jgi:26 proteasome complex subunit DSS1